MSVPYREVLGDADAQRVIAGTPRRLAAVYDWLGTERAEVQPAPGKWSPREVMCHLADCEVVWAWRLRYALERDDAVMQPFDQDRWARVYGQYTLAEARATFAALRAWNVALVGGLSEADRRKPTTHPERGAETLWTLVEIMAGHDLHHLRTLESLVVAPA